MIKKTDLLSLITFSLLLSGCVNNVPLSQLSDTSLCEMLHSRDGVAEELNRRIKDNTITVTHHECIMIGVNAASTPTVWEDQNCDCPDDLDSSGNKCGTRSAWNKPGGRRPICYGVVGN